MFFDKVLTFLRQKKTDEVRRNLKEYQSSKPLSVISRMRDNRQATLLHYAAEFGNEDIVQLLLDLGSEVDAQDTLERTPLMLSVQGKHESVIEILLKAGADLKVTDCQGKSSLQMVLSWKIMHAGKIRKIFKSTTLQEIIKIDLAKNFCDADFTFSRIAATGNVELVKLLLDQGYYTVNDRDTADGKTALHTAARWHDLNMVKILVHYGADVDALDDSKSTPLYDLYADRRSADSSAVIEILKILLSRMTLLTTSTCSGAMQIKNILSHESKEAVELVLQRINNLYVNDENKNSAVHYIAANFHACVIKLLRDRRFDVNARNKYGRTPLHVAAAQHLPHAVEFLLENGAEVSSLNDENISHLHVLFQTLDCYLNLDNAKKCIQLLINHGLDPLDKHLDANFVRALWLHSQVKWYSGDLNEAKVVLSFMEPIIELIAVNKRLGAEVTEFTLSKIYTQPSWIEHFDVCQRQIERMTDTKIYGDVTLFRFLTASITEISGYARNEELVSALESLLEEFGVNFPYRDLLRKRLGKANRLAELKTEAAATICRIVGSKNNAHYFPAEHIVDYLSVHDMENLQCV